MSFYCVLFCRSNDIHGQLENDNVLGYTRNARTVVADKYR